MIKTKVRKRARAAAGLEQEIRSERWEEFCNEFSRQHQGWLVMVMELDTEDLALGDKDAESAAHMLANAELWGVTAEPIDGSYTFTISVGDYPSHVTHVVRGPRRIVFEHTANGAHIGLRIDSAEGLTTLVRFRTPAVPEMLDGIAKSER